MKLFRLLAQTSRLQLATAILASVLSGVAELGATICVLESFRSGTVFWWQFASIALFSVAIGRYSRALLGKLASKSIARMRRRLVRSALHVPLQDLERIGFSRLLVAFTSDLVSVASTVRNLASLSASCAILLGCLAYIGWFSREIMLVTALLCLICIGGAVILRRLETQYHHVTREAWDRVVGIYGMVLDGVKQLKINRSLARQVLLSFEHRVREQQLSSAARGRYSDLVTTWTQAMFYVILGTAVFGPFGNAQLKLEFGLLALLQIRRPLRSLISDSSAFADASVAFQRITELGLKVSPSDRAPASADHPPIQSLSWRILHFKGVEFKYEDGAADFTLGPFEMAFRPGELVIVAGGNGSGKTTFAKLFTGLYTPTAGVIRVDDVAVRAQNVNKYRSRFAAVFGEFCLFEGVADLQADKLDLQAEQLAARLKLSRWMLAPPDLSGNRTALSSGERRRIALFRAVLEDRPIFVFDEWAVDQDSQFKNFFYEEFLPALRDSGKLIIAISGDETYFHIADRVLWLERGVPPTWREPSSFSKRLGAMGEIRQTGADAMTAADN